MEDLPFLIITILFSAFFSGMEIAYISSNKIRIEILKKQKNLNSRILTLFTENPSQYISTMLVGNNIALVIYGILMAGLLKPVIYNWVGNNDFVILLIQTLISTLIILVFGEFLPKTLFRTISDSSLRFFSIPLVIFFYLFYPVVLFSLTISQFLSRHLFGIRLSQEKSQTIISKMDLGDIIHDTQELSNEQHIDNEFKIFQNALDFNEVKLRECMVPRTEIVAVDEKSGIKELAKLFVETGYSKIFIYKESVDQIIGYVNSIDLFKSPKSIQKMLHHAPIVPETMAAQNLLKIFIQKKRSIAVVVDEFGGTSGIVSFEDILEEIFGEIEDEHDTVDVVSQEQPDGSFIFSGKMEIDAINEQYGMELEESDEYETLAGYILNHYGNFPKQGEIIKNIASDKNTYQILKASDTRIELVKLIPN
jgi:CBS domain containing-hemolysin-like protein